MGYIELPNDRGLEDSKIQKRVIQKNQQKREQEHHSLLKSPAIYTYFRELEEIEEEGNRWDQDEGITDYQRPVCEARRDSPLLKRVKTGLVKGIYAEFYVFEYLIKISRILELKDHQQILIVQILLIKQRLCITLSPHLHMLSELITLNMRNMRYPFSKFLQYNPIIFDWIKSQIEVKWLGVLSNTELWVLFYFRCHIYYKKLVL